MTIVFKKQQQIKLEVNAIFPSGLKENPPCHSLMPLQGPALSLGNHCLMQKK